MKPKPPRSADEIEAWLRMGREASRLGLPARLQVVSCYSPEPAEGVTSVTFADGTTRAVARPRTESLKRGDIKRGRAP